MDGTEDFSFPTVSDTYPYTIDSPPLWNPSPNPHQVYKGKRFENACFEAELISKGQRKSFLYEKEEDGMDLLWENFNEELSSTTASAASSSTEVVEVRCASAALAVAKSNGSLIPCKNCKPRMVMLVKVLKKLFSLANSQGKPTRRRRRSQVC